MPSSGSMVVSAGRTPLPAANLALLDTSVYIENFRLSRIGARKGYAANKLRDLAFDTLIALSARDFGATLITCNREDFAEINKHVALKLIFW